MNLTTYLLDNNARLAGDHKEKHAIPAVKAHVQRVLNLYWKKNIGLRQIAELEGISHSTVSRIVNSNPAPEFAHSILKKYGTIVAQI